MQKKGVYKLRRKTDVPEGEKIYPSIANWLTKKVVDVRTGGQRHKAPTQKTTTTNKTLSERKEN